MLPQLHISAGNGRKGDALLHWELLLHSSSLWQAVPEGLGATRWSSAGRALVGNRHVSCCRAGCLGIPLQQGRKVEKSLEHQVLLLSECQHGVGKLLFNQV